MPQRASTESGGHARHLVEQFAVAHELAPPLQVGQGLTQRHLQRSWLLSCLTTAQERPRGQAACRRKARRRAGKLISCFRLTSAPTRSFTSAKRLANVRFARCAGSGRRSRQPLGSLQHPWEVTMRRSGTQGVPSFAFGFYTTCESQTHNTGERVLGDAQELCTGAPALLNCLEIQTVATRHSAQGAHPAPFCAGSRPRASAATVLASPFAIAHSVTRLVLVPKGSPHVPA